jgi:hypothetical protein
MQEIRGLRSRFADVRILRGMKKTLTLSFVAFASISWTSCANNARSTAQLSLGAGSYEVDIADVGNDSTAGGLFELAFESVPETKFGGGARVRGLASDDDLDDDPPDGFPGTAEARDAEWFFHGTYDGGVDRQRLPLRMGLSIRSLELQDSISENGTTWSSVGPRVEFAPSLPLNDSDEIAVSATGLLGLGYSLTSIEDDTLGLDWDSDAVFVDAGVGLRCEFNRAYIDLGYRYLSSRYAESDVSGGLFVREIDATFSGLVFTLGFTF